MISGPVITGPKIKIGPVTKSYPFWGFRGGSVLVCFLFRYIKILWYSDNASGLNIERQKSGILWFGVLMINMNEECKVKSLI